MRLLTPAFAAVALLAAPFGTAFVPTAFAQTATAPAPMPPATMPPAPPAAASPGTSVPETTAPAPATTAPKPHKARHGGKRMSMHQRFASANTAQDGHLTLDQARAGKWAYAVRNFSTIDRDHKGYITEADIHAFAHARYMARHASAGAPASVAPTSAAPAAPMPAPSPAQ